MVPYILLLLLARRRGKSHVEMAAADKGFIQPTGAHFLDLFMFLEFVFTVTFLAEVICKRCLVDGLVFEGKECYSSSL